MVRLFKKHSVIAAYLMIILGTALLAIAYQCVLLPIGLVTGGFTGIGIIINNLTQGIMEGGVPLWVTNTALNIPVFVLAYLTIGKKFVGRTLFGTIMLSVWLAIIPEVDFPQGDFLLATLFGGFFTGVGMGLVLKANCTTGGTDMVAALVQRLAMRHHTVVHILFAVDGLVVLAGLFIFGLRATSYAIVAIFITTKASDAVLDGFKSSKAAFIISEYYEPIANQIMVELDRGVTGLDARGMYTGGEKCVLYCVVSKKEIVRVKEIVRDIDPKAFVILSDVHEVLGEGFIEYTKENQIC